MNVERRIKIRKRIVQALDEAYCMKREGKTVKRSTIITWVTQYGKQDDITRKEIESVLDEFDGWINDIEKVPSE